MKVYEYCTMKKLFTMAGEKKEKSWLYLRASRGCRWGPNGSGDKAMDVSRTCQGKRCVSLINAWVILKISVLILSLSVG